MRLLQQRQRQRLHYRERYEILRNILFIVDNTQPLYRNYMNKMRLAYAVGLTHPQMVDYLGQLLNSGLLIKMEFKPFSYEISERERRCLQLFDELEGDLKPNIDVGQVPDFGGLSLLLRPIAHLILGMESAWYLGWASSNH